MVQVNDDKACDGCKDGEPEEIEVTLRDVADVLDVGAASRTVRRLRKYAPELADRLTETASALRDADGAVSHFKDALRVADKFADEDLSEEEREALVVAATEHLKAAWAHASAAKQKLDHVGKKLDEWRGSPVFGFSRFSRKAD